MSWWAVGVAAAGVISSVAGSEKAGKASKKQTKFQNAIMMKQMERRNRIADQLESVANKLLNEQPISAREQSLIAASAKVADQTLQRIQKESIQSGLEAQAGTGFLKSDRMSDQVRKLVLEGAEGRSRIALGREQAVTDAIARNRQQALQALGVAGGFENTPQFQAPVGNTLAAFGSGLTAIGGAGIQNGGFGQQTQKAPITQVNPQTVNPDFMGPTNQQFPGS